MVKRLANVYRGTHLESFHTGSIAVVDSHGRLLAFTGDPSLRTCLRSAAKPFQAIPLIEYGGAEEFDLTGEEIALTCASHGGEPIHVSTAAAMLRKGEFDETDLLCGAHVPYDEKAAAELRAAGEQPSPLHNNCSGKHAGMLLATAGDGRAEQPLHRRRSSAAGPDAHDARRVRRPGERRDSRSRPTAAASPRFFCRCIARRLRTRG